MRLYDVAHARAGDKGDVSNISVIAFRAETWPLIEREITAERVAAHLGLDSAQDVTRYALPQLHALNFVLKGILGGGATRALALDTHDKCLASALLEMTIADDTVVTT